ncbi:MAG TPA: hypothetical protein VJB87_05135 [Candidatus Nanoarchaeia archaeon]|nr:hypothetical protein [Candidatus Nanoarchaeia archaeon]
MKNPLKTIDNCVTDSVRVVLTGYNWFTGGDKYDLARDIHALVPLVYIIGGVISHSSGGVSAGLGGAVGTFLSRKYPRNNIARMEYLEGSIEESGMLSIELEEKRDFSKKKGYTVGTAGLPLECFGVHSLGLGFMAMCAREIVTSLPDNLPKRRNVFVRAKNEVTTWVKLLSQQPAL